VAISTKFGVMGSNQEIQIDVDSRHHVDHQNEPGSSSNEEGNNVKRRGPSPEHKNSDTDSGTGDNDRSLLLSKERRGPRLSIKATSKKNYPPEWLKTLVMLLYTLSCLICMTIVETIVHDHVPLQNETQPLRDIAWNITAGWPFRSTYGVHACFRATEIIGLTLISLAGLHILSHRHTSIILRRFFFHMGTVYLYRVFTISLTILPVPKLHPGKCMPPTDGSVGAIISRSVSQLIGGGMDMTGQNMCGYRFYK
jgi:shingomyelin synthase